MKKRIKNLILMMALSPVAFMPISCSELNKKEDINKTDKTEDVDKENDNSNNTNSGLKENDKKPDSEPKADKNTESESKNEDESKPNSIESELKNNNDLLVAQDKFNQIKNRMLYFEEKKLTMPYFFYFQKGNNFLGGPIEENQGTKIDDLNSYINKLVTINKDNYNSQDYIELVKLFDDLDEKVTKYDDSNNKPTVVFESMPDDQKIKEELILEFESLRNKDYFIAKYDTNNNYISIDKMYPMYLDLISHEYYKYPFLSVGSAATTNFRVRNGNVFTFSASSNKLNSDAKKAMAKYVDEAINLLNENMSVYEKVFTLTRYVDDNLNYMYHSEGINDAYLKHWGVCKEYVEQAAILYSIAGLEFRIITGEQHIWFTFKNEAGKWFITDPTHLDPGAVDLDYPAVYQGSAKLISKYTDMFKYQKHLTWDSTINGVDNKKLDEVNNNISENESKNIFNNFIDSKTESDYHFFNSKVYLVKNGNLSYFDSKENNKSLSTINSNGFENNNLLNLMISYKNHLYVIKNDNNQQKLYDYNINDNTFTFVLDLNKNINDLEYYFENNQLKIKSNNEIVASIELAENDNKTNYELSLELKSYFVKFGLFYKLDDPDYKSLKEKLNNLESQSDLNLAENKQKMAEIANIINNKIQNS
ncbi:hypothetical protein AB5V95_00935 [Metamycoplasma spumans]|uniref:hypothetical protein n=1 Tax=Metamycoplasma spumans TaxID=92406 RepID=UPI0034DD4CAF